MYPGAERDIDTLVIDDVNANARSKYQVLVVGPQNNLRAAVCGIDGLVEDWVLIREHFFAFRGEQRRHRAAQRGRAKSDGPDQQVTQHHKPGYTRGWIHEEPFQ